MQRNKRWFASDNNAGVHPEILKAIVSANEGHAIGYGDDSYTKLAIKKFKESFGENIDVYFVFAGTPANVLGISAAAKPFNAVICADCAHLNTDECGALENYTGCKILNIPSMDGKITVGQVKKLLHGTGIEHHVQPRVVSITQATEYGTVYTQKEIGDIAEFCHKNGLLLHMDGARLCNAAASLGLNLKQITADSGVDILSFGGTKNGMMYGDAVVFFNRNLSKDFKYVRKQGMQLASKMRFISAQFIALLSNNLWLKNAKHANEMAALLAKEMKKFPDVKITQKVAANAIFAVIPKKFVPILQKEYFFYVWNEETSEVRIMTSFDTTKEDIMNFAELMRKVV